jgi:hypothetical protein
MARRFLPSLLLFAAVAAAEGELTFGKKPHRCAPLGFQVGVPEGWRTTEADTGLVARGGQLGFQVTREPLLHDPDGFATTWSVELRAKGIAVDAERAKAGRYRAYRAAWESEAAGGRSILVYRIHAPENEMLYNVAFSAPKGTDLAPLVKGVLKSFRCTAPDAKLEFQRESVGDQRLSFRLPVGYVELPRGVRLGGGGGAVYARSMAGYGKPRESGRITLMALFTHVAIPKAGGGGYTTANNLKDVLEWVWSGAQKDYERVKDRARTRPARYGGEKGYGLQAGGLSKEGVPKIYYAFCCKFKGFTYIVSIQVDERETRLHKDLFRKILGEMKFRG